ncbi:MAG: UPF0182 family protein, partial [bacterium]|nr:UPF0182 family protein [bacterium]
KPNELKLEMPYIQHAIDCTRKAYGLDRVEEVPFPGESNLTYEDIQNNLPTIRSIPLWDRRPLLDTYSQLQEIRTYYRFSGVDVDRYEVNGEYRQVMLAAREFSRAQLAVQSDTWVNRHLVYTHGYGLVISPSNQIVGEGLPSFFIQDIPPTSSVNMTVNRPEIYYGEGMRDYVVAHSKTQEFDYPQGDENVYTTYEGKGGVPINSFSRRLAFALRFGDPYLLFTDNLTSQSRILFDRHIGRRFGEEGPRRFLKLAPFLKFDSDPYVALVEGRIIWIQDAYTVTNMFPYAEPYGRPYVREMNYIRNSVKVIMDAYDGSVTFYAWDTQDPLIRAYMAIFPDLFQSAEAISPALRAHLRYPIDLFEIQAKLYNIYHMTTPQVFYGREDAWEIPTEYYGISDRPLKMTPYYLMAKLPDADREEYILMLPATPHDKPNMIGWLFARCDSPHYGQLQVYKLPKEKLIYGPMLVERRISQDTEVSREITLWDQRGSHVIRGNLLVIPIEESFIYVEPLYLRASQSGMPELKRVLVLHGETLAMGVNLEDALRQLFQSATLAKKPSAKPGKRIDLKTLAQEALRQFEEAQEWLQSGKFLEYGQAIDQLKSTLTQMTRQKEKTNGP